MTSSSLLLSPGRPASAPEPQPDPAVAAVQCVEPVAGAPVFAPRCAVLCAWQADFARWCAGPAAQAGLARWVAEPLLAPHTASVPVLLAACGQDRAVPLAEADARLAALVGRACGGDTAAARVALERLMPALTRRAGVWAAWPGVSFPAALYELAASAWEVICTYPLERRPSKIAANVAADAAYRLRGYTPAIDRHTVPTARPPELPAGIDGRRAGQAGPAAELLEALAAGVDAGVDPGQLRLLAELAVLGHRPAELAARGHVSDRTVRTRRAAAVGALRAALAGADGCGRPA